MRDHAIYTDASLSTALIVFAANKAEHTLTAAE